MPKYGNSIQVILSERGNMILNHTQSQSQVHHQDHTITSKFHGYIIHRSQLQPRDQSCNIHIHTNIIMKQEHAYISQS